MSDHVPDIERIPRPLRCCTWEKVDPEAIYHNGDLIMAAVPVVDRGDWHYEVFVLTVSCDENYFEVTLDGESWGWELSDADFILRLN